MTEYKTFIGELVNDPEKPYVCLRLHNICVIDDKPETYKSVTKCVEVRSRKKKTITKDKMVTEGLKEINKPFSNDEHIVIYI